MRILKKETKANTTHLYDINTKSKERKDKIEN